MADFNQTVEIAYNADISGLLKQLEKIPGMTKEEAAKMAKNIEKGLKDIEKASKKAAATNSKAMKQMSTSAKQAGKQFKQLKRSASEIGRGLTDLAVIFGDTDSPMGEFVNKIGIIAVTGGALLPLFASLRTAVISLGASTAAATGGLTLLAGAAAYLISTMGDTDEAAAEQSKQIQKLNKRYRKFAEELQKSIEKNEKFRQSVLATFAAIEEHGADLEQKKFELQFELGQIGASEFRQLVKGSQMGAAFEDIQSNFEKREKALIQQVTNEAGLATKSIMLLYDASNVLARQQISGAFVTPAMVDRIKSLGKEAALYKDTDAVLQDRINNKFPLMAKALRDEAFLVAKRYGQEVLANKELKKFTDERTKEQQKQEDLAETNILLQDKIWWQNYNQNKEKGKGNDLNKEKLTTLEKMAAIEDKIANSIKNQTQQRNKLLETSLKSTKTLAEFEEIVSQQHQIQVIGLLEQKQAKQALIDKTMESISLEKSSMEEIIMAYAHKNELEQEIANIEQERTNLTIQNLEKIAAEEERINNLRMQGATSMMTNIQSFAKSSIEFLSKQEDANVSLADKLFRLNQAGAIAQIGMDTSVAISKALALYGPIIGPLMAGGILAAKAAETAVVMSQPPPSASAHMGQPLAPDEQTIRVLQGEAVIDRKTVQNLGGEQGIRQLQQGANTDQRVVILNTFKHFDKYNKSARRLKGGKRRGSGGY